MAQAGQSGAVWVQAEALAQAAQVELVQVVSLQAEALAQVELVQVVLVQVLHHHQFPQQDSCHKSLGNSSSQYQHTTCGCRDSHIRHRLHLCKEWLLHLL